MHNIPPQSPAERLSDSFPHEARAAYQSEITKMSDIKPTSGTFRDGQWNLVHLGFLYDFMRLSDISTTRMAELMGITRQSVYHWFAKDDMKVSLLQRVFEVCGCRLTLSMVPLDPVLADSHLVVNMSLPHKGEQRRLAFLKAVFDRSGLSRDELAGRLGVGRSTVSRWLTADDCTIAQLYHIARTLSQKLTVTIEPL